MLKVYQIWNHTINKEDKKMKKSSMVDSMGVESFKRFGSRKSVSALSTLGEWRLSVIFIGRVKPRVLQAKIAFRSQSRSNGY